MEVLDACRKTEWLGRFILYAEEIDSTNDWAKKEAKAGAKHGLVTLADIQTKGRGRRGRQWMTEEGANIVMTVLLRPDFAPDRASMLTLVMGLSAAQAIESQVQLDVQIKWPNDVVIQGRKICGILTEMEVIGSGIDYVICGVGVNVNQSQFSDEIGSIATSLKKECGKDFERELLIAEILTRFEKNYESFCKTADLTGLMEEYNRLLINKGRVVRVLEPGNEYMALSHGINEQGELLVELEDGKIECVYAGEVSVRGLYGYV